MDTKADIQNNADIKLLVENFYTKVRADNILGPIFNEVFPLNWETHIPLIVKFWETILLDSSTYKENVMEKHMHLQKQHPFSPEHFKRWISLFYQTTDELFSGVVAQTAKKRALSIAGLMNFKMNGNNKMKII